MISSKILTIKFWHNQFGFSIAELVISAGIIAMISALVLANFRGSSQRAALDNEAERLSSILRQANINSLIGLTVNGARPAGGYGVHIVECQTDCAYQIFPDNNEDHLYTESTDIPFDRFGMFDDNVYIVGVALPAPVYEPASFLDLTFIPPQGEIFINGSQAYTQAEITLGFKNTNYTKKIILDRRTGQINIE